MSLSKMPDNCPVFLQTVIYIELLDFIFNT